MLKRELELSVDRTTMKKIQYPFILGTTSYIIPDDLVPNAYMLAPIVDDIELVLFVSRKVSNFPSCDVVKELAEIGVKYSTSYTVHLPIDNKAGSVDPLERTRFCDMAKRTIERCLPLSPTAWVLHLEGIDKNADKEKVDRWAERCNDVVETISSMLDNKASLTIENLGYPWRWHLETALKNETSLCCDIGHLWLYFSESWLEDFQSMLPKTNVIHLHGACKSEDHLSLASGDLEDLNTFFKIVAESNYREVITLEIFNEKDFYESMEVINTLWEQLHL